jgi:hypothetical protein
VGGVVGGILLGIFITVLFLFGRKRRRVAVDHHMDLIELPDGTASQNGRILTEEPLGGRLAKG